jgi:hypothetical protein
LSYFHMRLAMVTLLRFALRAVPVKRLRYRRLLAALPLLVGCGGAPPATLEATLIEVPAAPPFEEPLADEAEPPDVTPADPPPAAGPPPSASGGVATPRPPSGSIDQARRLFSDGQQAFAAGDYASARDAFLAAYKLVPHPAVLYNIAVAELRMNHRREACSYIAQWMQHNPAPAALQNARQAFGATCPGI